MTLRGALVASAHSFSFGVGYEALVERDDRKDADVARLSTTGVGSSRAKLVLRRARGPGARGGLGELMTTTQ